MMCYDVIFEILIVKSTRKRQMTPIPSERDKGLRIAERTQSMSKW